MTIKPESDVLWWATVYYKVVADVFIALWKSPNETQIEVVIDVEIVKFKLESSDTLNNAAHKMWSKYETLLELQKDLGSVLVTNPFWLLAKWKHYLEKLSKVGQQWVRNFEDMLDNIIENPERYLPNSHDLSREEVADLEGKSSSSMTEKVYVLTMTEMAHKGHANKLTYILRGDEEPQGRNFGDFEEKKSKRQQKKDKEETLALNVSMSPSGQYRNGAGRGGGGKGGATNFDLLCSDCGLFCKETKDSRCIIVKGDDISVEGLLGLKHSVYKPADGARWTIHAGLNDKIAKFLGPKLNLSTDSRKKLHDSLTKGVNILYDRRNKGGTDTKVVNNVTSKADQETMAKQANQIKQLKANAQAKKEEEEENEGDYEDNSEEEADT
jgi:hypothetical protein